MALTNQGNAASGQQVTHNHKLRENPMTIIPPKRRKHSFTQSLIAPPAAVFPLLCPVREVDWQRDWEPRLVISQSGYAETDCLFIAPAELHEAVWVITHYDPKAFEVVMYKITPGHTVGKLEIALADNGAGGTTAEVSYEYTALTPAGETFLQQFTAERYAGFMKDWEKEMNHYLKTGSKLA